LKKLLVVAALFAALVSVERANASGLVYGVADDYPVFHACGDTWWSSAKDIGYTELRMTVQWQGNNTIPNQANLAAAVLCARLNNITPVLAIYPARPSLIGSDDAAQQSFAGFAALVAAAFPTVKNFIVGNEPNVNRFWQPQYTNGQDAAAKDYEHTLAYSYDKIKVLRPDSTVWGPAISSRGNDNATAASNPSHSPVWFIADMAAAYKASGRTKPIFDAFNMHPYPPIQDTDPFSKAFQWPQAGAANLDRVKQALWDGFNGTAQPIPAEQPGGRVAQSVRFGDAGLPIELDEVGEQTNVLQTSHAGAYTQDGAENITPIDEPTQAHHYTDLAEMAACDPDVQALLYFPLIDNTPIAAGFQSGQLYADLAHKQSYGDMKTKIASAKGQCGSGVSGVPTTWTHTSDVIGAQAYFAGNDSPSSTVAAKPHGIGSLQVSVSANEDATYVATLTSSAGTAVGAPLTGTVQAYYKPAIKFTGTIPDGSYTVKVVLTAVTNTSRTTTLSSSPFAVGSGGSVGGITQLASIVGNLNLMFMQFNASSVTALTSILNNVFVSNTLQSFILKIQNLFVGPAIGDISGLQLLLPFRGTLSADAGGKAFTVKKGQKLKLPSLGKAKAGTYRYRLVLKSGANTVTMTSAPFKVSAKGKLSAVAKATPKPKKKPKHKKK
jgi:hypothetical protein